MDIDISPLARAIARLEEAVAAYQQDTSQTLIRDGLIQRFQFTYDISPNCYAAIWPPTRVHLN